MHTFINVGYNAAGLSYNYSVSDFSKFKPAYFGSTNFVFLD